MGSYNKVYTLYLIIFYIALFVFYFGLLSWKTTATEVETTRSARSTLLGQTMLIFNSGIVFFFFFKGHDAKISVILLVSVTAV